jgi:hypothetical protein
MLLTGPGLALKGHQHETENFGFGSTCGVVVDSGPALLVLALYVYNLLPA